MTPGQKLEVAGNAIINNAFVGDVGHGSTWAGFSHKSSISTAGYALLQNDTGVTTLINKKSGGGYIGFRVDNVDKMVLLDSGNVGIGTTSPSAELHIRDKGTPYYYVSTLFTTASPRCSCDTDNSSNCYPGFTDTASDVDVCYDWFAGPSVMQSSKYQRTDFTVSNGNVTTGGNFIMKNRTAHDNENYNDDQICRLLYAKPDGTIACKNGILWWGNTRTVDRNGGGEFQNHNTSMDAHTICFLVGMQIHQLNGYCVLENDDNSGCDNAGHTDEVDADGRCGDNVGYKVRYQNAWCQTKCYGN